MKNAYFVTMLKGQSEMIIIDIAAKKKTFYENLRKLNFRCF